MQLLERADPLQRPPPHHRRGREARRVAGGRHPPRVPRHVPGRVQHAPHHHALPQPGEHGRRGVDPRQPARRRGAPGRLRQDDPGHADGRDQRRRARHHGHRRPPAQGQLARRGAGHLHRLPPLPAGAPRGQDHRRRLGRPAGRHHPQPRTLRRDGHRVDHGSDLRDAGHRPPRQRRHTRGRLPPPPARRAGGPPHSRPGPARRDARALRHRAFSSATPSGRCTPWAAPPTPSSTSRPSRAARASSWTSTCSTSCRGRPRSCWT